MKSFYFAAPRSRQRGSCVARDANFPGLRICDSKRVLRTSLR
jgi:hypothetical protein